MRPPDLSVRSRRTGDDKLPTPDTAARNGATIYNPRGKQSVKLMRSCACATRIAPRATTNATNPASVPDSVFFFFSLA
jgi:hypothetical protein